MGGPASLKFQMLPVRQAQQQANLDEPAAIRDMKKKVLYKQLSDQWFLPEENSKGVNRRYLVRVYTGAVYRILIMDYKRFDMELTPAQLKKAPFLSSADVYSKIDALLVEGGQRPLGFEVGCFPEDTWLYKVARWVDRINSAGVYLEALQALAGAPILDTHRMITAKRNAEQVLITQPGAAGRRLMDQPAVYNALKSVWDAHKKHISRQREIEQLRMQYEASQAKEVLDAAQVQSCLVKASLTLYSARTGHETEVIFMEGENANASRLELVGITHL